MGGIAGGLSAISYEIATAENLTVEASGTILMVVFLGGVGHFYGPILGAILFTLLQTVLSFETDLWQLYLGVLFLATVMFFPRGLAGVLALHGPVLRTGRISAVWRPYLATVGSGAMGVLGWAGLAELAFFVRRAPVGEPDITLFWVTFDSQDVWVWLLFSVIAVGGVWMAKRNAPDLAAVWTDPAQN